MLNHMQTALQARRPSAPTALEPCSIGTSGKGTILHSFPGTNGRVAKDQIAREKRRGPEVSPSINGKMVEFARNETGVLSYPTITDGQ